MYEFIKAIKKRWQSTGAGHLYDFINDLSAEQDDGSVNHNFYSWQWLLFLSNIKQTQKKFAINYLQILIKSMETNKLETSLYNYHMLKKKRGICYNYWQAMIFNVLYFREKPNLCVMFDTLSAMSSINLFHTAFTS